MQVKGLLLFQDQEAEERGCSLRASASFAEHLEAERAVIISLKKTRIQFSP